METTRICERDLINRLAMLESTQRVLWDFLMDVTDESRLVPERFQRFAGNMPVNRRRGPFSAWGLFFGRIPRATPKYPCSWPIHAVGKEAGKGLLPRSNPDSSPLARG